MNNFAKQKTLICILLVWMVGASSCSSYKNLSEAPAPSTEHLLRDSPDRRQDSISVADVPWKEYFADPKLQDLLAEGLKNNYDLRVAVSRIEQAEANLMMSRAANLPTVDVGWQSDHTRTSSGISGTKVLGYYSHVNQFGFSASWEIDLWGKLNSQAKIKYASYLSSTENKNLVQTNLVADIAKAYYNLMSLDEQLRITRETAVSLQESVETITHLMVAGQQNAAAVEQSKALLYSTQLSIPDLENQVRQQENALCVLLGRNPSPVNRSNMKEQAVSSSLSDGVPVSFLAKRPDVRQAELSLRSAYASVDVAKTSFYPSLTISSASLGYSGGFADFFKPANIAANIVAGLSQPLLNKKQLKGNLQLARAEQEEALLTFESTVLNAGQEVSDILFGYQSSLRKTTDRQNQIISLIKSVDYTQDLLKAGEANYTEVLSAQRDLLSAQLNQVSDKLDQLDYGVNLYKALGGGVQ